MESLSEKKSKRLHVDFNDPYPPFPREVFFDLNNACNCKCIFCANRKISDYATLDKSLAFRLLQEFYDFGTREVAFYATGEPFIRKDLAEFIEKARSIGYEYIFLTSNGALATPKRAKPVLHAGLDSIKFSVNAGTRESYKKVHGIDVFDKVIENIKWFHSYRKESGLTFRIYLSMVPTHITNGEWPILQKIISPYVDEMDYRGISNQGGNVLENNETENIDARNILGSMLNNQCIGKCPDIFFRCTVTPQGFLSACVVDYQNYLAVADLKKTSARNAWHCEAMVTLRKRHIQGNLSGYMCDNCINNQNAEIFPINNELYRPFATGKSK